MTILQKELRGDLDRVLEIIGDFEMMWYKHHGSVWTDQNYQKFESYRRKYIEMRLRRIGKD